MKTPLSRSKAIKDAERGRPCPRGHGCPRSCPATFMGFTVPMHRRKAEEALASRLTPHASRLWLILLLFCAWSVSRADDVSTAFDQANKLYEEGKFTDAAAAYQKMLQQGRASPALYFN